MLLIKADEGDKPMKKQDEYLYLKQVNAKIHSDLIILKEIFQTTPNTVAQ